MTGDVSGRTPVKLAGYTVYLTHSVRCLKDVAALVRDWQGSVQRAAAGLPTGLARPVRLEQRATAIAEASQLRPLLEPINTNKWLEKIRSAGGAWKGEG